METKGKRTADQAYQENIKRIREQLKKLERGIAAHQADQRKDQGNWGYVGDASYVVEKLMDAADFITGEEL